MFILTVIHAGALARKTNLAICLFGAYRARNNEPIVQTDADALQPSSQEAQRHCENSKPKKSSVESEQCFLARI
ncbi:MAG: hypothetical protein Q9162_006426 [Coniocarpon cinnabarinum]